MSLRLTAIYPALALLAGPAACGKKTTSSTNYKTTNEAAGEGYDVYVNASNEKRPMPLPRSILILLITSVALITAGCGDPVEEARTKLGEMNIDYTPRSLIKAAANNNVKVVELFVVAGFDLGGAAGNDAVEAAASLGDEEILEVLLDHGASATLAAVHAARRAGHRNIVKLLHDAGATPTEETLNQMVAIPGGTFDMGDLSGDGFSNEKPVRSVTVPAFKLGKHEVTFALWDACVIDGGCNDYSPDDEGWGRSNRPVINVSWDDAQRFIQWLNGRTGENYRLPSEAEWEYVARARSTTEYGWGNDIGSNRANCDGCGSQWDDDRTAPAGSFAANPWGLHDVPGNVWEWVQDCWNGSYKGAPTDGSAWESGDCRLRGVRGGSWGGGPADLRSAVRSRTTRSTRDPHLGFRLAQDK